MRKKITYSHKKLGRSKADGLAYYNEREIVIDERLKGIDHLDTAIHELVHLFHPDLEESKVLKQGREMAKILWAMGYRRIIL